MSAFATPLPMEFCTRAKGFPPPAASPASLPPRAEPSIWPTAFFPAKGYVLSQGAAGTIVAPGLAGNPTNSSHRPRVEPAASEPAVAPFQMGLPALDAFPRSCGPASPPGALAFCRHVPWVLQIPSDTRPCAPRSLPTLPSLAEFSVPTNRYSSRPDSKARWA